jgi:23S rRNA pseudouridine955/2504/2580 synthase
LADPVFHGVEYVVAGERDAGQRLDNYLIRTQKGIPKSRLYRMLRKGEVRINKKRVDAHTKIQLGDSIRLPPRIRPQEAEASTGELAFWAKQLRESILEETPDWIAFNKPSGLAVHSGSGVPVGVIEALKAYWPHTDNWELVHRIDKETSGCLLVAKKPSVLKMLQQDWRAGAIQKSYWALLAGPFGRDKRVSAPLHRTVRGQERFVVVDEAGKASCTDFQVKARYNEATLVSAQLHTGRTHQIRVHATHIQHPVLGDPKYHTELSEELSKKWNIHRLCLHAEHLSFKVHGKSVTLKAPCGLILENILKSLG